MHSATRASNPGLTVAHYCVAGSMVLAGLFVVSRFHFLMFHGLAELFSIVVAWSVFFLVWNTRRVARNAALLFLGVAYFFIGLLDGVHALAYKGMGIFPAVLEANYATQLWIAARGLEAVSLLLFSLRIDKPFRTWIVLGAYGVATALILAAIFAWRLFPDCYIDGQGLTMFKKASEYAICITLALSIAMLFRKRHLLDPSVLYLMTGAVAATIAAELSFTFYVSVYGLSNVAGHFFKIISFFLIYLALVREFLTRPYATIFRAAEMEKAALRESEERHRTILETTLDGFWLADANGRLLQVNESYCVMSGYGEQELVGLRISDLESAETPAAIEAHMQKIVAQGGDRFETRHRRKDGTEFDVEISVRYQPEANLFVAFMRDITDRNKAMAELNRATRLLAKISSAQSAFIATGSVQATCDRMLDDLVAMTDSQFGFLDEVLTDSDGSLYKLSLSISDIAWDADSKKLYEGLRAKNIEFRNLQNLAGLPALTGERVISNDVENDPRAGGVPAGHPGISTFMGLPLYFADNLVGVAGVANRAGGYDAEMARFLDPFLAACASIIHASRQAAKEEMMMSALREREKFLDAVVENIPDMIFVKDAADLRFIRLNRAAEKLLGYSRQDLIGNSDAEFFAEDEAGFFAEKDRQVLEQKEMCDIPEEAIHTRQGDKRILRTKKIPVLDENGVPEYLLGISEDITERKRTEDALRESNERLQKVFDSQLDAIFVLDAEVPPNIIDCNRAASKIFGYEPEEMIGATTERLHIDEDHLAQFQDILLRTFKREGHLRDFEYTMKRNDGSVFPSSHTVMEMTHAAGGRAGWISVVGDLTERKAAEARLQQAQKMESIGSLAGGITHDFNNILFPIVGLSELLMDDLPQDSAQYTSAREIFNAGQRGSELVKQILTFSRQAEHKMMPVRIQKILREVFKLMRATVPSNIRISQHIQGDCGLVHGDPTQIHQIAMNLITNAYHAVEPTSGEISVTLKETALGSDDLPADNLQPGAHAVITVSDTGTGIAAEAMDKIFEPYFTTKEQGKGTGLGLAVVYAIVKAHGGSIHVDSRVGAGTTVRVYFPLIVKRAVQTSVEVLGTCPTGTERILLIDDEEAVIKLGKLMLERLGYHVTELTRSLEALETFIAAPSDFDLVVTDMTMPYMTGDRLARKMLAVRPDIPIIICTGFSERLNPDQAADIGIKGFLMKPVVRSEMASLIREVLDGAKPGS
jgi:PAS domain S-box-containing protein